MRIKAKESAGLAAAILLGGCLDQPTKAEREFDREYLHILNPIAEIIKGTESKEIELAFIDQHFPDSIVCFHGHYSISSLSQDDLRKFGSKIPSTQVPSKRDYPENTIGLSIISGDSQYNFQLPIKAGLYFRGDEKCVRSRGGRLKNSNGHLIVLGK